MRNFPRDLYTHIGPDLDAHLSCWLVRKFVPTMFNAQILYVGADWDGIGMKNGDMAVDVYAGSRGIKGIQDPDGTVHSCASYIASRYLRREDAEAIRDLVRFVDIQDAYGSVVNHLIKDASHEARRIFAANSIGAILRALEFTHPNDPHTVFSRMCEIFDGYLEMGRSNVRARLEASRVQLFASGRVALVEGRKEKGINHILWGRGVEAIVYVDGFNLGVVRRGDGALLRDGTRFRADHPEIQKIVRMAEKTVWFAHPKRFLYCRGSRKAPANSKSKVNPQELIEAISNLLK